MPALRYRILLLALPLLAPGADPPRIVSRMEERPVLVRLPDRTLAGWFTREISGSDQLIEIRSRDNGRSWSEPETVYRFGPPAGTFSGAEPLVDRSGEIQLFLCRRTKYTLGERGEGERPAGDAYHGQRIDLWHMKTTGGRKQWEAPKQIWAGYTGAMNSVLQMRNGRIVFPFSYYVNRNWRNRGTGFAAFTYRGVFDCTVLYSDDNGDTFHLSPTPLSVETPDITGAYGCVEPVAIQLKDGRVWNLVRVQRGRFYESFSGDGSRFSEPQPTALVNSDSPAGLTRTDDGRLVLLWNNCQRYPYAFGGRQVLHAAVSEDEGKTWIGYREVMRDPKADEPPPPGGDFGTAYPFPVTANDGLVLFTSGQGAGRAAIVAFDPAWLYETEAHSDFQTGAGDWTFFGCKGVERVAHPSKPGAWVLQIAKPSEDYPAGAVWNFPNGMAGTIRVRLQTRPGFADALLGIADHYSVPWDKDDRYYNLWNVPLASLKLASGRWHEVAVEWDATARMAKVRVDGQASIALPLNHTTAGANYLRVRSTAAKDSAGLLIESVDVRIARRR